MQPIKIVYKVTSSIYFNFQFQRCAATILFKVVDLLANKVEHKTKQEFSEENYSPRGHFQICRMF